MWFKKHLNLTWGIIIASGQLSRLLPDSKIFILSSLYVYLGIVIIGTLWVLHEKRRNYAWILVPFSVLILGNRAEINA